MSYGPAATPSLDVTSTDDDNPPRRPPLYEEYHYRDRDLPQHNLSLPFPDGSHAKFLWAANHGSHVEFAEYMQEIMLNAYLAYSAKRAYVFDNYTWERAGYEISYRNGKPIPARIPLSALISGPIIGDPMPDKDVPRSVSREYFLSVCPRTDRVVLDTQMIEDSLPADATASQIVERWMTELRTIESPCVELARSSPELFRTANIADVFPALSKSPILSGFGWSPLIQDGFRRNIRYFTSDSTFDDSPSTMQTSTMPLKGLLAIHVPRGDYEERCGEAYSHAETFTGFNAIPGLPAKYTAPQIEAPDNTFQVTRKHCLPSISEIVEKVLAVDEPHITRVYVMSHAPEPWLEELKKALLTAHRWSDGIAASCNLQLSWESKFVAEVVDMYVGQRAERFIGNGVSRIRHILQRVHRSPL